MMDKQIGKVPSRTEIRTMVNAGQRKTQKVLGCTLTTEFDDIRTFGGTLPETQI